jgi:hypothetical protein
MQRGGGGGIVLSMSKVKIIILIIFFIITLFFQEVEGSSNQQRRCPKEFVYNKQEDECMPKCFPEYLKKEVLEGDIAGIILSILSFFSCWIYCLTAVLK